MKTEIEGKHTPTPDYTLPKPWKIHLTSNHDFVGISYWDGDCTGTVLEIRRPNEYQIQALKEMVRAVNSHEALLEAAFAVVDDPEIRHVAHREFLGKLDDLKKAIAQAEAQS